MRTGTRGDISVEETNVGGQAEATRAEIIDAVQRFLGNRDQPWVEAEDPASEWREGDPRGTPERAAGGSKEEGSNDREVALPPSILQGPGAGTGTSGRKNTESEEGRGSGSKRSYWTPTERAVLPETERASWEDLRFDLQYELEYLPALIEEIRNHICREELTHRGDRTDNPHYPDLGPRAKRRTHNCFELCAGATRGG